MDESAGTQMQPERHAKAEVSHRGAEADRHFLFEGARYGLVADRAIRESDLLNCRVTLVRLDDGTEVPVRASEMHAAYGGAPPASPLPDRLDLRRAVEDVLNAGFDGRWPADILKLLGRHHAFRTNAENARSAPACPLAVRLAHPETLPFDDEHVPAAAEDLELRRALAGAGLEIGALHTRLRLPEARRVLYADALSPVEAARMFPEVASHAAIARPDFLAGADRLPLPAGALDFVATSHVLEHVRNPVRALAEWARAVKPGGHVFIRLPDMRSGNDRHRTPSTPQQVLDDFTASPASPGYRLAERNRYRDWARHFSGLAAPAQVDLWAEVLRRVRYPIHFHCWTLAHFLPLLELLSQRGILEATVAGTRERSDGYEFSVLLRIPDGADRRTRWSAGPGME